VIAIFAIVLLAQPAIPAPGPDEDPEDVQARVRYERAIRADFDGRREDALREAQACIAVRPEGRFAIASQSLIARLHGVEVPAVRSTGVGPRTELVISSTLSGLYLSSLVASATSAGQKGTVAWLMLGTGGALVGSILATSEFHVPQSMPQMLQNGIGYGSWAALIGEGIADDFHSNHPEGVVAVSAAGGAVLGILSSQFLTGGDSGAMTAAMIYGGALPTATVYILGGDKNASRTYQWTALIGSTAGIAIGPLLNGRLHWSRGRWNLVSLGGGVGALMGGGLAILSDATGQGATALAAGGAVAGLLLTGWLTSDFGADEPRPGSALLHLEDGKLSAGNAAAAIGPTRFLDKNAAYIRVLDGTF
jgi:hypothetical protein